MTSQPAYPPAEAPTAEVRSAEARAAVTGAGDLLRLSTTLHLSTGKTLNPGYYLVTHSHSLWPRGMMRILPLRMDENTGDFNPAGAQISLPMEALDRFRIV